MAQVLVVEDEPVVRAIISDEAMSLGHDVVAVWGGQEAIDRLHQEVFDLLVLDLMLGPVTGWDVLAELNRLGYRDRTRVLVVTALSSEWEHMWGWRHGVDQYLTKPFEPEQLRATMKETLELPSEAIEARRRKELEKAELLFKLESAFDEPAT